MKCSVIINRGNGSIETFVGTIASETTTHALVLTPDNPEVGEWYAKRGRCVKVVKQVEKE